MVALGGIVLAVSAGALDATTASLVAPFAAAAVATTALAIGIYRRARRKRLRAAARRAHHNLGVQPAR
jgi:hypothetical protein